ncbi:5-methylcytosine-specific restriction enzyme subunit McrC [Candidatus Methylobacter favarea]|uniref:5-methylcytosine-specific restriction enzyme subunit McrC n=1 Tax=Candidatus Methylobacter favarea TaxID=2707345 RepID=A0A8S0XHK6_9GAMM|nr:McrC family protein [Candidatus Methylobacter favarea]CAA9891923.1 5-methylcytosine-specific restriction enzyme subunit McrC [Candidatus Methylobacter favarea]
MNNRKLITVFEHQSLILKQKIGSVIFDENDLTALQKYYGEKGVPYFSLINNGVRFNEYVGVIQVGNAVIEVLPKADKSPTATNDITTWRDILVHMLSAVGIFDIHAPSNSSLKLKSNSILDLYFALFIKEVEYLLHNGLIKQYRKKEGNVTALKGCLLFGKHIQQNLTHQERFYVRHTTYDVEHKLHFILYKTIRLLKQINTNTALHSRIGVLLLHFPEMPDMRVSEATFEQLIFNRKTYAYKKAIGIAQLLLLRYHPDVINGRHNVLALMFDMNMLWEKFVYVSLRKHKKPGTTITAQSSKLFWQTETGNRSTIRADIVINKDKENCVVLDTKWKNLNGCNPSPDDLRQMYIYHRYYHAKRVALIYPGMESFKSGFYLDTTTGKKTDKECSVISLSVEPDIKTWQKYISQQAAKDILKLDGDPPQNLLISAK